MGRVLCSSDWHGCKAAFQIFDFLNEDDTLIFLGDAADRGPHGLELMERLIRDPRVKYLEGNHEQMMLQCVPDMLEFGKRAGSLWLGHNGGNTTWKALKEKYTDDCILHFLQKLDRKMIHNFITYKNIDNKKIVLEHAGYTPGPQYRHHDPLWDREHFHDSWKKSETDYIIHGHTPVQYLEFYYGYNSQPKKDAEKMKAQIEFDKTGDVTNWKPTILHYCDNHKIDLDMCTITSGRVALLDLDTFEEIYFDDKE